MLDERQLGTATNFRHVRLHHCKFVIIPNNKHLTADTGNLWSLLRSPPPLGPALHSAASDVLGKAST